MSPCARSGYPQVIARYALVAVLWIAPWIVAAPIADAQSSDPAAPRTRRVRPPDDLGRRGLVSVPAWAVWGAAAATVAAAAGVLLRHAIRGGMR